MLWRVLMVVAAAAEISPALLPDDECNGFEDGCALNAVQLRGALLVNSTEETNSSWGPPACTFQGKSYRHDEWEHCMHCNYKWCQCNHGHWSKCSKFEPPKCTYGWKTYHHGEWEHCTGFNCDFEWCQCYKGKWKNCHGHGNHVGYKMDDAGRPAEKATAFQMAQQVVGLALFVWSWLKCWWDTAVNASWIAQEGYDIKYAAPLGVLGIGVVMTSIIGVLEFSQDGHYVGALISAVDLDTPYVILTQAKPIVRGEDVKSWQKLQMRNAIWRSVPLACITFFLALRDLVEIPSCQLLSCASILGTGIFVDGQGTFAQAAAAQGMNVTRLYRWYEIRQSVTEKSLTDLFQPSFRRKYMETEELIWKSAHCSESQWHPANKLYLQDLSETWIMNPVTRPEDGKLGGMGEGNLLMTNMQFTDMTKGKLGRNMAIRDTMLDLTYKAPGVSIFVRKRQLCVFLGLRVDCVASCAWRVAWIALLVDMLIAWHVIWSAVSS
ncbi:unnamed protein product [Symbiodinium natans]|uniref:Uncharacterized protein n=1 Tax=Symbiodinium natans TaxID=878477 RepID=A0A812PUD6_9DINO|nr:unnamed protein product [Symbiodinium natans]